jgi:hypothetical protein
MNAVPPALGGVTQYGIDAAPETSVTDMHTCVVEMVRPRMTCSPALKVNPG